MKDPFDVAWEAVLHYRKVPVGEDYAAALVAADACEEAGLFDDAAWYRFCGNPRPRPYQKAPTGLKNVLFYGVASNMKPEAPKHA